MNSAKLVRDDTDDKAMVRTSFAEFIENLSVPKRDCPSFIRSIRRGIISTQDFRAMSRAARGHHKQGLLILSIPPARECQRNTAATGNAK